MYANRRIAGTILALLLAGPAAAAEAPADPTGPEIGTPRSDVRSYLEASREGDYERAAGFLDLRRLPPARRMRQGASLARELKAVLDKTLWVDLDQLSDEPAGRGDDGLPEGHDLLGRIETASGPVAIELVRVDGSWKFSSDTVARIPALYEEFGDPRLAEYLPAIFFETRVLEIELWQWIGLLVLVGAAVLLSRLAVSALTAVLRPVLARSRTRFDDHLLEAAAGPAQLLLVVGLFSAGTHLLALSVPAMHFFGGLETLLAVVAATWLVLRLIDVLGELAERQFIERGQRSATSIVPLGRKTAKVFATAIAGLACLDSFGFDVTALLAGLGVGGLAVALAAQKTLEHLFGGAMLIADRPVQVGDFCRFGDRVGTVEEIGMRSTRVRTLDRTLVTIPNAEFSALQLENFTARDKIWYHPRIGLRYETTPDQLRYVLVEVRRMLYAHPKVDPDPARIRFIGFGAYSLDLDIFAYVRVTDFGEFLEIAEDLNLRIMDIVEASGTGFAFPSSTTYLAKDDGLDGEKTRDAEAAVHEWRSRGELYLPAFPSDRIAALRDSLDYPNEGSPDHAKGARG